MALTEKQFLNATVVDLQKHAFSLDSQGNVCLNTKPE
jgi:hypothetical protein